MKILSAINYEEVEEYIRHLPEIVLFDTAEDKGSLMELASSAVYDLLLVSKELSGSEEMEDVIEILLGEGNRNRRIIYMYGEYDDCCDSFIRFLINHCIYDFHVGDAITSKDIERLIFSPAGKNKAFSYYQSHFDNEHQLNYGKSRPKGNSRFLNSATLINQGFKRFFKGSGNKRINFENLVISVISNQATGKSHTAWNLAFCFSGRKYSTSLLNIDRGYSANLYFDIDEIYHDLLDFTIHNDEHRIILDKCCKRKNLNIITGKLGDEREIGREDFIKLLYNIRTKSDITIIDTKTGISDLTRLSIKSSTFDLMIFDCDIMHFHMNMSMLEGLKDDFVPEKTIAVINNTNVRSSSHKFIYNELVNSGIPFKDISFISSCGILSSEMMHTGLAPYITAGEENKGFVCDMDSLLEGLSVRAGRGGFATGLFGR